MEQLGKKFEVRIFLIVVTVKLSCIEHRYCWVIPKKFQFLKQILLYPVICSKLRWIHTLLAAHEEV